MKKIIVMLLSLILLSLMLPQGVFASSGKTFSTIHEGHREGETYWQVDDFYLVDLKLYEEGVGEGEGAAEHFWVKTDEPYASGDEETEIKLLDFNKLAKEIGKYDAAKIMPFSSIVYGGNKVYALVFAGQNFDENISPSYENVIVRLNLDDISHKVFKLRGSAGNMPALAKQYKGNLYFGADIDKLYRLSSSGKVSRVASGLGDVSLSQSDSGCKFVYGFNPKGYSGTLKIFDLNKKQTVKKIAGVRGYYASAPKIYYGKKGKSGFKIYVANANGSNPKTICKIKNKSGIEMTFAKADSEHIYYYALDLNGDFAREYYKYNRESGKTEKISYIEYAEATLDYIEGYEVLDEQYRDLFDEENDSEE